MNAATTSTRLKRAAKRGFTLIEMAVVIAIIAITAAFAYTSMQGTDEARDAAMVQSAQAALQSVVSQGSARTDLAPASLNQTDVLNALKASFSTQAANSAVKFSPTGGNYMMTITGKGRTATFGIGANGDVNLLSLSNFTDYTVQNGIIFKP